MKFVLKSSTDILACGFKFHFPSQTRLRWEATTWRTGCLCYPIFEQRLAMDSLSFPDLNQYFPHVLRLRAGKEFLPVHVLGKIIGKLGDQFNIKEACLCGNRRHKEN